MKIPSIFSRVLLVFFFNLIFLLYPKLSNAQSESGVYLEGGGAVPYYSLNYFREIFSAEKTKVYARVGGSIWESGVAFPVGVSMLFGTGNHHPIITLGATPLSEGFRFWKREDADILLDLVIGMEYRYQPIAKSFFVNIGLFPYLRLDPTVDKISEKETAFNFRLGVGVGWFF